MIYAILHKFIPYFPRAGAYRDPPVMFVENFNAFQVYFDRRAGKIGREENIAASPEDQQRAVMHVVPSEEVFKLLNGREHRKIAGLRINAKCVVTFEGLVFEQCHPPAFEKQS